MHKAYIIQDTDIELTMPDGSKQIYTLQAPTGEAANWYRVAVDVPGGQPYYKDAIRRRQRAFSYYYPEFHFSYGHHRMFTTMLLAAQNIALLTGWNTWKIDCLLQNEEAVKNYLAGMAVATDAPADPVPSGDLELIFVGRKRESWQQALAYYFYYVPGLMIITADSTEYTVDSTEVRIY